MKNTFVKSLVYSMPVSILIAIMSANNVAIQLDNYYVFYSWNDLYLVSWLCLFILSTLILSIPIALALKSDSKNRAWIITLDMLCFLPFGIIFYLISLGWAFSAWCSTYKKKTKINYIKKEIVNNPDYINLQKQDRIEYLHNIKKQTITEMTKNVEKLESTHNKLSDIPTDIAKYIKSNDISGLKAIISKLENKIIAIDELVESETTPKKQKTFDLDDDD